MRRTATKRAWNMVGTLANLSAVSISVADGAKLNKSKRHGLDGISSRLILGVCADLIAPHISIIFNSSLANGIFPDDWKSARVTPLFKHGERSDIDNYHPVSVVSIIGKVFERIIYNQLFAYLSDHNFLSKHH